MGYWAIDGSKGFLIKRKVVKLEPVGGMGNVCNAIYREGNGVSSGRHYWQINFDVLRSDVGKGSTAVGLTSNDHFGTGYACKSINYSGDLNVDGMQATERGRVVADFGPKLKQGDTVGILAVFENNRLKVYIHVNDINLGLSFDVLASNFESIYPMVSFNYEGSASIAKKSNIPASITSRSPIVLSGIVGSWKLAKYNTQEIPYPIAPMCVFVSTGEDKYTWHVNKFRTGLVNANGTWKSNNIIVPGGTSNRPEKSEKEKKILDLMATVNKVELVESDLSISSDAISSTWVRLRIAPFVGGDLFTAPSSSESATSSRSAASSDTIASSDTMDMESPSSDFY